MTTRKLFQILLPLFDNEGEQFPSEFFKVVRKDLTEQFGGLTAYSRSPATGLWKDEGDSLNIDKIIIYEVMADELDAYFWKNYKETLKNRFRQEDIIIRCSDISMI